MNYISKIILITLIMFSFEAFGASNMTDAGTTSSTKDLKKRISNGEDVNFQDEDGDTALMMAVYSGYINSVKILLEAGADVNLRNNDGEDAINNIGYRVKSNDKEILDLLLAKGADINAADHDGDTALMMAVYSGLLKSVQLLLEAGADAQLENNDGEAALGNIGYRVKPTDREILDLLIAKGADIDAKDNDGDTALMMAVRSGYLKSVKLLLAAGADVGLENNDGESAIGNIVFQNNSADGDILDLLIAKGGDIDTKDHDGGSPLFYAVSFGYTDLVEELLDRDADLEVKNNDGQTPIWEICDADDNNIKILDILLKKGANINSIDNEGDTMSALSACADGSKILAYLESKGLK